MTEQFIAGIIGAPFGLKGFVRLKPFSGEIEHLLKLKSAIVRLNGEERLLTIEECSPIPPAVALHFADYDSPETAKTLNGAELLISRKDAAPLQNGEMYVEDLRGMAVLAGETVLGTIVAIIEGGGGDLAEIRLSDGTQKLVPFRKEFFTGIDPERKQARLQNLWILE